MIHPTAVIHPKAEIDATTIVGPYAVVDAGVVIGAGCQLGPHAYITGATTIGKGNRFHAGCVIGDAPQDLKYADAPTRVRIGDGNVFREHVTVHRANKVEEDTVIGSNNFLMASAHVGHNSTLGNHVIMANGALLGGHVTVQDRAFISGNCLVHQFTRVGTLAMMQGGSGISKDLPPFTIARGNNHICGLNMVGIRRAGFDPQERLELKRLYRLLFRTGFPLKERLSRARDEFRSSRAQLMIDFVESSRRGICADVGSDAESD